MARYRKARRSKRYFAKARRSKRGSKGLVGGLMPVITAAGYGFVREKIANSSPFQMIASKIPAGQYADEASMMIGAWALGKFVPSLKGITNTAILIEASRIGSGVSNGSSQSGATGYFS